MPVRRPCIDCGTATGGTRCPSCTRRRQGRATGSTTGSTARGYDRQWRAVRLEILERDGHRCRWCGAPATTVDHVVPLIDGGPRLDPANLAAACGPCNFGHRGNRG